MYVYIYMYICIYMSGSRKMCVQFCYSVTFLLKNKLKPCTSLLKCHLLLYKILGYLIKFFAA